MSNINYQALRMAAENATPGEWCSDDYYGVIADAGLNANYYIASCSGPDNRANKRFIAAANPATVLAVLDELEAAKKRIAELEAREISLPERSSMLHRTDFHEDYQTVMAYKVSEVIAAIRAAGIRIKGE
ncbi:ead/Ea22-like family protein [Escherichia coli]|uniref:ead/Ea22-like family protein n=1 Tax=Escherichia coli TaxID=562 RepID=UPI0032DBF075